LKDYTKGPKGVPFFHLRPTARGITLVTTHPDPDMAMRGISDIAPPRCIAMLDLAASFVNGASVDWDSVKYVIKPGKNVIKPEKKRGFTKRKAGSRENKPEKEFTIQAWLINEIVKGNADLCKRLRVSDLYFLGSEIIWQEGTPNKGQRIDIVAHDGEGQVLFLELKAESNMKGRPKSAYNRAYDQMLKYLKIYNSHDEEFSEFIGHYPSIPPIEKVKSFKGFVVTGDCNNLNIESLDITEVKLEGSHMTM
jgi:hypothetical protein